MRMNNDQLLEELALRVRSGEISKEQLSSKLQLSSPEPEAESSDALGANMKHFSVTKMLYVLGAAIVVIGIVIFTAQIWDDIGSIVRILITLGLGLIMAGNGAMLLKKESSRSLGVIFHLIGGALIPGGMVVMLSEFNLEGDWTIAFSFVAITLFYLIISSVQRHALVTFFAIANATASIYLLLNAVVGGPMERWEIRDIYQYMTMAIGASYLFMAKAFQVNHNKHLTGLLYFLGSMGFLGATFSMVFDSFPWTVAYFAFLFLGLYLSTYFKSKAILLVSTLFLIGHVSYITGEYFANSLGWPISLVILGFIFIGLGYASITINNRYIKGTS